MIRGLSLDIRAREGLCQKSDGRANKDRTTGTTGATGTTGPRNLLSLANKFSLTCPNVNSKASRGTDVTNGETIQPMPNGRPRESEIDSHCSYVPAGRASKLQ